MAIGSINKIVKVTKYLFTCPPVHQSALWIIALSAFLSLLGHTLFTPLQFFLFLSVPALLSALLTPPAVHRLGGKLFVKHSFLTSLLFLGVFGLFLRVGLTLSFLVQINPVDVIIFSLASTLILRLIVLTIIPPLPFGRAFLPSFLYPLFAFAALAFFTNITAYLAEFALSTLLAVTLTWTFLKLLDYPSLKKLNIPSTDLLSLSLEEFIGFKVKENPFSHIGNVQEVPYQSALLQTAKKKILLTIPWLHPGPLGTFGGNVPENLCRQFRKKFDEAIFFHTYVNHSLDPVFPQEITKRISSIFPQTKKKSSKSTKVLKESKNGVTVLGQRIGDIYIFFSSFAPQVTEDVSPEIGLPLLKRLKDKALLIDCHNSAGPEGSTMTDVMPGSKNEKALLEAIDSLTKRLDKAKEYPLQVSAVSAEDAELDKFGVNSINFLALKIGNQKTGFAVLDTNNLAYGFRKKLLRRLGSLGFDHAEVITTDAHVSNYAMKFHGKIGNVEGGKTTALITRLAKQALEEFEPASLSYDMRRLKTKVFGQSFFENLVDVGSHLGMYAKIFTVILAAVFLSLSWALFQFF